MNKLKIKSTLFALTCMLAMACSNADSKKEQSATTDAPVQNNTGSAKIEFRERLHNYGTLDAGEEIAYSFKFTNTGNANLYIDSVTTDCGCIFSEFPKEAIAPTESSYIDVIFNSSGEYGRTLKQLFVYSCGNKEPEKLSIVADINNEIFN